MLKLRPWLAKDKYQELTPNVEKLVYLLGSPEGSALPALKSTLHESIIDQLKAAGASTIRSCIQDELIAPAEKRRAGQYAADTWCYLSLWVESRSLHPELKKILAPISSFLYAYAVAESLQIQHEHCADGEYVEGMNEVVTFRRPPGMSREAFLDTWLGSHTQIAIDTQSTFGYIQHIVGDALDEGSPLFDAIVEENFPTAAMDSDAAFYDSVGKPEQQQERLNIMVESVMRFIDMESINIMPMSEYNF